MMRRATLCLLTQKKTELSLFFFSLTIFLIIEFKILHLCHFAVEKHQIACFTIVIVHFYVLLTPFPPLPSFDRALL